MREVLHVTGVLVMKFCNVYCCSRDGFGESCHFLQYWLNEQSMFPVGFYV